MTPQQIPVLVGALVTNQSAFGALTKEESQWVIRNPKDAINLFVREVKKSFALRKIFKPVFIDLNFTIEALDGRRKICDAKDVFKGEIDRRFQSFGLNVTDEPTGEIIPAVYELKEKFSFNSAWNNFFTVHQMIVFCEKYFALFCKESNIFFALKTKEECFIACIHKGCSSGHLFAEVFGLEDNAAWGGKGRHYVAVPQSLFI